MCLRVASEVTLLEIPPCQTPMYGVAYSCSYVLLLLLFVLLFSSPLFSLLVFFGTLLSSSSWIVLRAFFRSLLLVHEFFFVYRRVGGRRILELGAAFQSSSLFGQPVVRGATFLHQHLSVRIILIESLVAAVIPQVLQRPSQCVSIGCLSLVAPTAILIKLVFLLSLFVCWVRVWVCGSLFSFALCSSLLLYRLNLRGTLGPYFLQAYSWCLPSWVIFSLGSAVLSRPSPPRKLAHSLPKRKCFSLYIPAPSYTTCADPCLVPAPNLTDFWSLETIGIGDDPSPTLPDAIHSDFKRTIRHVDGRYQVYWPWKDNADDLPDDFGHAVGRLKSLSRRFERDPTSAERGKTTCLLSPTSGQFGRQTTCCFFASNPSTGAIDTRPLTGHRKWAKLSSSRSRVNRALPGNLACRRRCPQP